MCCWRVVVSGCRFLSLAVVCGLTVGCLCWDGCCGYFGGGLVFVVWGVVCGFPRVGLRTWCLGLWLDCLRWVASMDVRVEVAVGLCLVLLTWVGWVRMCWQFVWAFVLVFWVLWLRW